MTIFSLFVLVASASAYIIKSVQPKLEIEQDASLLQIEQDASSHEPLLTSAFCKTLYTKPEDFFKKGGVSCKGIMGPKAGVDAYCQKNWQEGSTAAQSGQGILGLNDPVDALCAAKRDAGTCKAGAVTYNRLALKDYSFCKNMAYVYCALKGKLKGSTTPNIKMASNPAKMEQVAFGKAGKVPLTHETSGITMHEFCMLDAVCSNNGVAAGQLFFPTLTEFKCTPGPKDAEFLTFLTT